MNYIKLSEVINEVKVFYNSYFESGFDVDEAIFYPEVRLLIKKCSKIIHPINSEKVEIKNYTGCLPEDFHMLRKAIATCYKEEYIDAPETQPIIVTEFHTDYKINHCDFKACKSECGEYINIIQRMHDGTLVKYPHSFPVSTSSRTFVHKQNNINIKAEENIDIHNNTITTSFAEGTLFIEYYATLKEDGEVIIPDNEIIVSAFKEKIKETVLEYLLMNNTLQVAQLYTLQAAKAKEAVRKMITMLKVTEYEDMDAITLSNRNLYNRIDRGY